jgi:hypothetical protein
MKHLRSQNLKFHELYPTQLDCNRMELSSGFDSYPRYFSSLHVGMNLFQQLSVSRIKKKSMEIDVKCHQYR